MSFRCDKTRAMNPEKTIKSICCAAFGALLVLGSARTAGASERRFTYTYESATLGKGEREIEPWNTVRVGRTGFYAGVDSRLEVEVGLTDRLQTSVYLNLSGANEDVTLPNGQKAREASMRHGGVSSEWKYKLLDPVADPLGLALYVELTMAPTEAAVETKLILDKRFRNLLIAGNVVGEYEADFETRPTGHETFLEVDLGVAYFVSQAVSLGIEGRSDNEVGEEWEWSALFAGPVAGYSTEGWWATLSVLPQLANLHRQPNTPHLELSDHERVNARLIFGAHF